MPKFYFSVRENDRVTVDEEGYEFDDHEHAHREAVRTIAAIAAEEIPRDGKLELTVEVADDTRHILFRTHVRFEPG